MKNILIISVLLVLGLKGFGQNYVTFKSDTFNCIDSGNLKQGLWKTFEVHYESKNLQPYMDDEGKMHSFPDIRCVPREITDSSLIVTEEGFYKDDKKIGTWKYYICDTPSSRTIEREITYHENGSITLLHLTDNYLIEINGDTSSITGYINNTDSILVNCQNKQCVFSIDNDKVFRDFRYNEMIDFEMELEKAINGMYATEIRKIRASKK